MGKRSKPTPAATPTWILQLRKILESRALLIAVVAVLLATVRIVTTYPVFSHTSDEPAHIACGMEWLARGTYTLEPQHPPLARILAALGPFLAGTPDPGKTEMYTEGMALIYDNANVLTLARLGTLPFFWLACAVMYLAGLRWYGKAQAALAVFLFTLLPPVLAHAGLATTDMALMGTLGLTVYLLLRWAETPTLGWGAMLGFAAALSILSKFSSLVFFPSCLAMLLIWAVIAEGPRALGKWLTPPHAVSAAFAAAVLVAVVFAAYRFSFEPLLAGIKQAREHQALGHESYLLGDVSVTGFVWFYPVALAVKTPLGILALVSCGSWLAWKRRSQGALAVPVAFALGILAVGLYSRINIGIRHLLPIYFCVALLAAAYLWERMERSAPKVALLFVAWAAISGAWHHPDYIAYFNELAGSEPENILADSDLDWGQDIRRLGKRLGELNAKALAFTPFFQVDLTKYPGIPPAKPGHPFTPAPGWNAVSITYWKAYKLGQLQALIPVKVWPDQLQPTERIGRGILLYYVPPSSE